MSVTATLRLAIDATEVLELNVPAASTKTVIHENFSDLIYLTAETAPPISQVAAFEVALVAGAGTIDFTALSGTNGIVIDGTDLKVRAIKITAAPGNAEPILIENGVPNGYALAGAAFSVELDTGQSILFFGNTQTPAVGANSKLLQLTGTGTDGLKVIVLLG